LAPAGSGTSAERSALSGTPGAFDRIALAAAFDSEHVHALLPHLPVKGGLAMANNISIYSVGGCQVTIVLGASGVAASGWRSCLRTSALVISVIAGLLKMALSLLAIR